jgi:hypothetical protein
MIWLPFLKLAWVPQLCGLPKDVVFNLNSPIACNLGKDLCLHFFCQEVRLLCNATRMYVEGAGSVCCLVSCVRAMSLHIECGVVQRVRFECVLCACGVCQCVRCLLCCLRVFV